MRALRAKIEELQEMIRERNAALALARRKLEEAGMTGLAPRTPPKRR